MKPEEQLKQELLKLQKIESTYTYKLNEAKRTSGFKFFGESRKVKDAKKALASIEMRIKNKKHQIANFSKSQEQTNKRGFNNVTENSRESASKVNSKQPPTQGKVAPTRGI